MAAANAPSSDSAGATQNLPPLWDTFPAERYPLREIGTGFTAQSVQGSEADSCAAIATEMLTETRNVVLSSVSSEGGSSVCPLGDTELFAVPPLPLPSGYPKDGLLILRNERLFPGMVGIYLPLKGMLWVREDGTSNLSGFFRRQASKFETAGLMAATTNMDEYLDIYHALYSPVLEAAANRQQFKVMRSVMEAGLQYYKKDGSEARKELLDLRRRVVLLRSQAASSGRESVNSNASVDSSSGAQAERNGWISTDEYMENRRRISDSKQSDDRNASEDPKDPAVGSECFRRASITQGDVSEDMDDSSAKGRSARNSSGNERSAKIAQQVVTGAAPKQKGPFRLWKNKTGKEGYDKKTPS